MKTLFRILAVIYINTFRRILSFSINSFIYVKALFSGKGKDVKEKIIAISNSIKNLEDVNVLYRQFKYKSDPVNGLIDYSPTIFTFIYQNETGDCDNASFYAQWLYNEFAKKNFNFRKNTSFSQMAIVTYPNNFRELLNIIVTEFKNVIRFFKKEKEVKTIMRWNHSIFYNESDKIVYSSGQIYFNTTLTEFIHDFYGKDGAYTTAETLTVKY
jgi:hypothetical protein